MVHGLPGHVTRVADPRVCVGVGEFSESLFMERGKKTEASHKRVGWGGGYE